MRRRPSLSALVDGERMERRRSSVSLGVVEDAMSSRPSSADRLALRQPQGTSMRELGRSKSKRLLQSKSRDEVGHPPLNRHHSVGKVGDVVMMEKWQMSKSEAAGRDGQHRPLSIEANTSERNFVDQYEGRPSDDFVEPEGNADRMAVERKYGLQRRSSRKLKTAKEVLPLVGWNASDSLSRVSDKGHGRSHGQQWMYPSTNNQTTTGEQSRALLAYHEESLREDENGSVGSNDENNATKTEQAEMNAQSIMGWGGTSVASNGSDDEHMAKEDSNRGSDNGTEIYEVFRPRGDFREHSGQALEPKVEEEFDSRRPWRKAPAVMKPQTMRGLSETGSVMSFNMDASAAILTKRPDRNFDSGITCECTGGEQAGERRVGMENAAQSNFGDSVDFEGSELDELEMAKAALNQTDSAYGDKERFRSNISNNNNNSENRGIYPYGGNNPQVNYIGEHFVADDFDDKNGSGISMPEGDLLETAKSQPPPERFNDHPAPQSGPVDSNDAVRNRNEDCITSSFSSSSEEGECDENKEVSNRNESRNGVLGPIRSNSEVSKVEVDIVPLESVSQTKMEATDSHTAATAQVLSESAESGQRHSMESGGASSESYADPDETLALEDESRNITQIYLLGSSPRHDGAIVATAQHDHGSSSMKDSNSHRGKGESKRVQAGGESGMLRDRGRTNVPKGDDKTNLKSDGEESKDMSVTEGELCTEEQQSSRYVQWQKITESYHFCDDSHELENDESPNVGSPIYSTDECDRYRLEHDDRDLIYPALFPSGHSGSGRNTRPDSSNMTPPQMSKYSSTERRGDKIQECVGPYVWERRKLFLIGLLFSLTLIVGLAVAFSVVKNDHTSRSGDDTNSPDSIVPTFDAGGISVPTPRPTLFLDPMLSPSPTKPTSTHLSSPPWQIIPSAPSYRLLQTIQGANQNNFAGISNSFSSDGTFVAVGFKQADGLLPKSGLARIYRLENSTWYLFGNELHGSASGDEFGASVSLSDDGQRVAVGAYSSDEGGTSSGSVKVFRYSYSSDTWDQYGSTIWGLEPLDRAGYSVSLSGNGDRLAVGAPRGGNNTGSVRVFEHNGTDWFQLGQELLGDLPRELAGYSCSLSREGDTVAVSFFRSSSEGLSKNGRVTIFRLFRTETSASWQYLGEDIVGENSGDQNGISVSLSGDGSLVVVGANGYDHLGVSNVGYCRVFRNEGKRWIQLGSSLRGTLYGEQSGVSTSISRDGNRVACGGANSPLNGEKSGVVRVFEHIEGEWVQIGNDLSSSAGAAFGTSLSLSEKGDYLAVGAPEKSIGNLSNVGSLHIFVLGG